MKDPGPYAQLVIVASPDSSLRLEIARTMKAAGWSSDTVDGGAAALAAIEDRAYALLLLDGCLPDLDAEELVELVRQVRPEMGVLLMDRDPRRFRVPGGHEASLEVRTALHVLRADPESGIGEDRVVSVESPRGREPVVLQGRAPGSDSVDALPGMIGMSPAIHEVYRMVRLVASRTTPVLITGETGTGKELVARAVHESSPRRTQPFVVVNCAAIPEELLEAELFGFERGAFTGAVRSSQGRIRAASGGTLFLDEVGEMPPAMQAKLLRFLQEREVQRLGSSDVSHIDTRVVAATNQILAEEVSGGRFRADLFYRLSVFPIDIAPLRERTDDILPLAEHFLGRLCEEARSPLKVITREGARLLLEHLWPGNVRELEHAIERALILSGDDPELLLTASPLHPRVAGRITSGSPSASDLAVPAPAAALAAV